VSKPFSLSRSKIIRVGAVTAARAASWLAIPAIPIHTPILIPTTLTPTLDFTAAMVGGALITIAADTMVAAAFTTESFH
jgi:hypothetical protein